MCNSDSGKGETIRGDEWNRDAVAISVVMPINRSPDHRITRFRLLCFLLIGIPALLCAAIATAADLPHTSLEWREAAQPQKYFDATGRRAAAFGRQTGLFEAWIYPIKVLHGFRLEFQQDGMIEPVRGEMWLREIVVRPEATTLIYAHPLFTVKQTIWVPGDAAALVQFLEVDSSKPLIVTASFVPDLKPMWPSSLGGQHSGWNAESRAVELADATGIATAMIGSPSTDAATQFLDHQLIGGEMRLRLRLDGKEKAAPAVIVITNGMGRDSAGQARAEYGNVTAHALDLYRERVAAEQQYLDHTMHLQTSDAALNRAFEWAKVAIHAGWVCRPRNHTEIAQLSGVPDVAGPDCGLIAGYGPSGDGERPGFAWWFGGDAMMSSWAMEDFGDLTGAADALRFLKARQRSDGKMMHEMSQSVDLADWFGKYHFAYYHADTTPMYLFSIARFAQHSQDRQFLQEFWPSAKRAYAYCLSTLDSSDGLMDNTKAGLAAVEVGVLRGKVVKDIYLEGFWVAALEAMVDLAGHMNDPQLAADARTRLEKAVHSLETEWWNPEQKYFAFGMSADGKRADMMGNWPAILIGLNASGDTGKAVAELEHLASPELSADWGTRWLADTSEFYDPVSYNNGTVWPFMQTFVMLAQLRHGDLLNGLMTLQHTVQLTGLQSPGALPEHLNGDRYLAGERSVPHQLFSSVAIVVGSIEAERHLAAGSRQHAVSVAPGIAVVPPAGPLQPGERSTGLKIINLHHDEKARTVTLTVAGLAGHRYSLEIVGTRALTATGGRLTKTPAGYLLELEFSDDPKPDVYLSRTVELKY